jgi:hypothetical protein
MTDVLEDMAGSSMRPGAKHPLGAVIDPKPVVLPRRVMLRHRRKRSRARPVRRPTERTPRWRSAPSFDARSSAAGTRCRPVGKEARHETTCTTSPFACVPGFPARRMARRATESGMGKPSDRATSPAPTPAGFSKPGDGASASRRAAPSCRPRAISRAAMTQDADDLEVGGASACRDAGNQGPARSRTKGRRRCRCLRGRDAGAQMKNTRAAYPPDFRAAAPDLGPRARRTRGSGLACRRHRPHLSARCRAGDDADDVDADAADDEDADGVGADDMASRR